MLVGAGNNNNNDTYTAIFPYQKLSNAPLQLNDYDELKQWHSEQSMINKKWANYISAMY